jgi:hydroxymethylpyrimidine pyrophosphatase-like HAD family hydrolase
VPVETYYDVSAFDNCDIEYFNKVAMYRVPAEEFYSAMAHINEKFGDRVIVNTSSTGFIEIISNKHTKYIGAKTIAEHFGFNENEVITIGDSNNDMTLLRYGYGIAVANAENDLKSIAKHVAPSVQENALRYVIEKALLGEEF